jgi:CubicO group peptidase (beta-lactamase class C family)
MLTLTICFRNLVETGAEEGGAFALYHNGEMVVEFYGGYADPDAKVPFEKDTLVAAFSSTKAVAAITLAVLVDR